MSEAMRHNQGKPQLSYLLDFPSATEAFAKVCEMGAKKYARDNWKKGRKYRDTIDSLLRHLTKYANGEDNDAESGLPHMAHVMWNAAALLEYQVRHPEMDDRDKPNHNNLLLNDGEEWPESEECRTCYFEKIEANQYPCTFCISNGGCQLKWEPKQ